MIKFFRQIRQQLLAQNRFNKYLIYAVGEIVLVVVGILIALSINNWNEEQKLRKLERTYLTGILDDLKTDTTYINNVVIPNFLDNHRVRHQYLDSLERNNLLTVDSLVSKIAHPALLSASGGSFHSTVGTYNSIISEGNTAIIRDKELFNAIQKLYEVWYKRNNEYSLRRDKLMDDIMFKHALNIKYDNRIDLFQNKQLLADIWLMLSRKRQYVELLSQIEQEIVTVIKGIENQLLKD